MVTVVVRVGGGWWRGGVGRLGGVVLKWLSWVLVY